MKQFKTLKSCNFLSIDEFDKEVEKYLGMGFEILKINTIEIHNVAKIFVFLTKNKEN